MITRVESRVPGLASSDLVGRVGPTENVTPNKKERVVQGSERGGSWWREQLMVRLRGKYWLGTLKEYQKGQGGQRGQETHAPRGGHGPHHAGPGRPCIGGCIWLHLKTPTKET